MESSYTTRTAVQKLKDSCDLCSASKLRCNKQKPTCARCASLNQPCSYSPARRAGRPHRLRREKSQQQYLVRPFGSFIEPTISSNRSSEMSFDGASFLGVQTKTPEENNQQQQSAENSHCRAPNPDTREVDCTRTAISILEQLDIARRTTGITCVSSATTDACQRLLTILVCPCSEKPGVALLVACGCISLMDTIHYCHIAQGTPIPELSTSTTTTPGTEQDISSWTRPSSSQSLVESSQGGVEQLAKIAKLILQFTDRYSQEPKGGAGWAHTTWLVTPIAALLRFRLQSVTHQATKRLVF